MDDIARVISGLRLDRKTEHLTGKIQVLVVDDQQSVREGTRALLRFASDMDATREASNGQEAVQLVTEEQPDVVLMDVRMPVMDGIEAARHIKEGWPQVKVIVLSMYVEHREAALEAGAEQFLVKGKMSGLLADTIRGLISEREQTDN
jgi:YesN/AraC family two-component response regulator